MDLEHLSDDTLRVLKKEIKKEEQRRKDLEDSPLILQIVEEGGCYLENSGNHNHIEGLCKFDWNCPVILTSCARNRTEISKKNMKIKCYDDNLEERRDSEAWLAKYFEKNLPPINSLKKFYDVGEWRNDEEDQFYVAGCVRIDVWFKPFSEEMTEGLGILLEDIDCQPYIFFKKEDKYHYFFGPRSVKIQTTPSDLKKVWNGERSLTLNGEVWDIFTLEVMSCCEEASDINYLPHEEHCEMMLKHLMPFF